MAEHLHERPIDSGGVRLGTYLVAELGLDHVEGRLNVATLMVVPVELRLIESEEMVHLLPQGTGLPMKHLGNGVLLEGDVGYPADRIDYL